MMPDSGRLDDPSLSDTEWEELRDLRRMQHRWRHAAAEYGAYSTASSEVVDRGRGDDSAAMVSRPVSELKVRRQMRDLITDETQTAFDERASWAEDLAVFEAVSSVNRSLAMSGPAIRATHPPDLPGGENPFQVVQLLAVADHFEAS